MPYIDKEFANDVAKQVLEVLEKNKVQIYLIDTIFGIAKEHANETVVCKNDL